MTCKVVRSIVMLRLQALDDVIKDYFKCGRSYKVILARLKEVHGISRSLSWLKVNLSRLGLRRRGLTYSRDSLVLNCLRKELRTSNRLCGYRSMTRVLREKYGLVVKRDTVMNMLRRIDVEGVQDRLHNRLTRRCYAAKGPNFVWHIDGYDKLSTFGFSIHGCIDGFSRRIIWMKVSYTNRVPGVILHHYLEATQVLDGCPMVIRMDRGTENVLVASAQYAMRCGHHDSHAGDQSFKYGRSQSNIRIESFWSMLRRHKSGWWISVLKGLEGNGLFDPMNDTHKKCLSVVYHKIIERELEDFVYYWNTHKIRKSRNNCIGGIPIDLFDMPIHYGTQNYIQPLDRDVWLLAAKEAVKPTPSYSSSFCLRCIHLTKEKFGIDLFKDVDIHNSLDVYNYLVQNA